MKSGNPAKAIEAFGLEERCEMGAGTTIRLYRVYLRGLAYLAARQGAEAAAQFQKIVDHRGARLRTYVDPDFKDVVRISVNSLWSHGFLELDAEPMIVSVPETKSRYTVVQGLNMWTDVFMSAGTRTNSGKSGRYLIAGPKWNGTAPKDVTVTFRSSTRYAWVLIQMSAKSPADYPEIHALQDELSITPLSRSCPRP